jgi:hypothetical protein
VIALAGYLIFAPPPPRLNQPAVSPSSIVQPKTSTAVPSFPRPTVTRLTNEDLKTKTLFQIEEIISGSSGQPAGTSSDKPAPFKMPSLSEGIYLPRHLSTAEVQRFRDTAPEDYLRERLSKLFDIPTSELSHSQINTMVDTLSQILTGDAEFSSAAPLTFSALINRGDQTPMYPRTSFIPLDLKIYVCFQNQGALKGINQVFMKWTNTVTEEIHYLGKQPIDPKAANGYLCLESQKEWERGSYLVQLFDNRLNCLSQGKYEIK